MFPVRNESLTLRPFKFHTLFSELHRTTHHYANSLLQLVFLYSSIHSPHHNRNTSLTWTLNAFLWEEGQFDNVVSTAQVNTSKSNNSELVNFITLQKQEWRRQNCFNIKIPPELWRKCWQTLWRTMSILLVKHNFKTAFWNLENACKLELEVIYLFMQD